ncbi:dephospho-CoA kinase [Leuconostoc palmae]|uniref:dephospho-CoA kinase n=1 Tax=Leuconostoc palmae TaxID=501487 RepID=UPI001C7DA97D|nr:dephospho-CoA kinase [Leuconostoc palmae]
MMIVGLTGGIATGKSSVSRLLQAAGLPIVDADLVAREVVEPGTHTLESIKLEFGADMIDNGVLNRKKLGDIVFGNPHALSRLNKLMEPAICSAMADKIAFWRAQKTPILILDIPLLFEHNYHKKYPVDKIIVVKSSSEIQFKRLKLRDQLDNFQAQNRIKAQLPMSLKVSQADYVIDNNGDEDQLVSNVNHLISELKRIAIAYDKEPRDN